MYSKTILIGNAGKDAEIRYTTGGTPVATFSLATTAKYKAKNGELEEKTAWHNIVCWGKLAEIAAEYVCKGKQVMIEGRIEYGTYQKDGVTHHKMEIVAEEMKLLGSGPKRN